MYGGGHILMRSLAGEMTTVRKERPLEACFRLSPRGMCVCVYAFVLGKSEPVGFALRPPFGKTFLLQLSMVRNEALGVSSQLPSFRGMEARTMRRYLDQ